MQERVLAARDFVTNSALAKSYTARKSLALRIVVWLNVTHVITAGQVTVITVEVAATRLDL
jgi:hypothetical protein